jgi:hypothetical protein
MVYSPILVESLSMRSNSCSFDLSFNFGWTISGLQRSHILPSWPSSWVHSTSISCPLKS